MSFNLRSEWVRAVAGCALAWAVGLEPPVASAQSCMTDADCPLALICETSRVVEKCAAAPPGSGGEPPDSGGCAVEEEEVAEPTCVYEPIECTQDSDCDPGFSCQPLGRVERCSSDAMPSLCMPGQSCEQSQPSEPVCTEVQVLNYCFPERQDCSADGDCSPGWRCEALPADAQDNPPPGWEDANEVCLPEGIALALAGEVEISSKSTSHAEADSNASGARSPAGDEEAEGMAAGAGDSGCSFTAGTGGGSALLPGLALLVLAALGVRRRPA